jgi:hypothetical protein
MKFSMVLSAMVQMKNTLSKFLDFEHKELNPELNKSAAPFIADFEDEMSVLTPMSVGQEINVETQTHEKSNLNLLVIHDDSAFHTKYSLASLRKKGVKIVDMPSMFDAKTVVPFLLLNDHSIVVVRNPSKDILPILMNIMRHGIVWYKSEDTPKPIRVNITVWVFVDILAWSEKLVKQTKKNEPVKVKDLLEKQFGVHGKEFLSLFESVVDCTQYSNLEIIGSRFLKY